MQTDARFRGWPDGQTAGRYAEMAFVYLVGVVDDWHYGLSIPSVAATRVAITRRHRSQVTYSAR